MLNGCVVCCALEMICDSYVIFWMCLIFFIKQKTAYEMRISDWSSDVCSSDLGLKSGDRIVAADGTSIGRFQDLQTYVALRAETPIEIGRASCRERVCQYV